MILIRPTRYQPLLIGGPIILFQETGPQDCDSALVMVYIPDETMGHPGNIYLDFSPRR